MARNNQLLYSSCRMCGQRFRYADLRQCEDCGDSLCPACWGDGDEQFCEECSTFLTLPEREKRGRRL